MGHGRDAATAELLRRVPWRRRRAVRRLLAVPFAPPRLTSLPLDRMIVEVPVPRRGRRRDRAAAVLARWRGRAAGGLRRATRRLVAACRPGRAR